MRKAAGPPTDGFTSTSPGDKSDQARFGWS